MKKILAIAAALAVSVGLAVAPAASAQDLGAVPGRTQVAIQYTDGTRAGTANAHESRPALSLSKLYLGYWVLKYGAPEDKAQVFEMIRVSHDGIASNLDARYPQAIPAIIRDYQLGDTRYNGGWGRSNTSVADVAGFVSAIRNDPAAAPLLAGMYQSAPVAADGYPQNYGTATLPGAQGTKFGWSDNHDVNATVSIGDNWVIAANTFGSAQTLTLDVQTAGPAGAGTFVGGQYTSGHLIDALTCQDPIGSSRQLTAGIPRDVPLPREVSAVVPGC